MRGQEAGHSEPPDDVSAPPLAASQPPYLALRQRRAAPEEVSLGAISLQT